MKKILVSLLVLALCAPAMAATVTVVSSGPGTATIAVNAEGAVNIVGLGLDVDVTAGTVDGCTVDTATFDIFPDAAHDLEVATPGSYTYGAGTPIANQDAAGEASVSAAFAVSVGALNGIGTAGATGAASVEITITAAAGATVEISENAIRGGIVLTDGNGEDITNGTAGVVTVVIPPAGCSVFPCCADFNLTKVINGAVDPVVNIFDLDAFVTYVNWAKNGTTFVVGPADPDYDARYNFDPSIAAINIFDLDALVSFVNAHKGTTWLVNCNNNPQL